MSREPRTLGVYSDGPLALVETADGERIAPDGADFPFLTFVCTVGLEFEATLLFGRVHGRVEANGRPLLPPSIVVEPLPFYESLLDVGQHLLSRMWLVPSADFNRLAYREHSARPGRVTLQFSCLASGDASWDQFEVPRLELGSLLEPLVAALGPATVEELRTLRGQVST